MDWKEYYHSHMATAAEAVGRIRSGDRVVLEHACGEPVYLVDKLVENAAAYRDVEIVHMVAMGKGAYCLPENAGHFRHNSLFVGSSTRRAVESGQGDFTPCFFFEIPRLFHTTLPVDVAMVSVTPPDGEGRVSLGVSCDYTLAAVKAAKTVIAQVNPGDVERAIGQNCAALIPDGATLQLGIGAIPDAVLLFLKDKKDLGIHSEMFSDGVVELAEAGVITNAKKTLKPGKFVVTFLMGTKRLYDFVNNNPDVEMQPVDYVNDPFVIARNDKLISINSCVQMDLMGQAASESVGLKQISGTGGQVDFVRGASASKGGVSIMAFPATAAKGTVSKIVPFLDHGSAVTTCRCDVDYAVTEYGTAHLKGETLRTRARNLIAIAHPDFRAPLVEEFEKRFHCAF